MHLYRIVLLLSVLIGSTALADKPDAQTEVQILIDKAEAGSSDTAQRLFVYLNGEFLFRWKTSTGREQLENKTKSGRVYTSSTDVGTFRFYARKLLHRSILWDADMPFAQFYDRGVAIHAAAPAAYKDLGTRASGGCVRLKNDEAERLYRLVNCVGSENSAVTVFEGKKGKIAPELSDREFRHTNRLEPKFVLDCATYEDQLVFEDGRTLSCKSTKQDMPWEERECGQKKSIALGIRAGDGDGAESKRAMEELERVEREEVSNLNKREYERIKRLNEEQAQKRREYDESVRRYQRELEEYNRRYGR